MTRFRDVISRNWRGRRIVLQRGHYGTGALAHLRPIRHRDAHVGQRCFDFALNPFDLRQIGLAVDLIELPRLVAERVGVLSTIAVAAAVTASAIELHDPSATVAAYFQHRMHDEMNG